MDLAQLDLAQHANVGAVLEILHPISGDNLTHDGQNVTITLLGAESSAMREVMGARARKQLASKKPAQISSIEEAEALSSEMLASVTVSWVGLVENGEPVACDRESCIRIYKKYAWLRSQVDAFVSDRANFFKA